MTVQLIGAVEPHYALSTSILCTLPTQYSTMTFGASCVATQYATYSPIVGSRSKRLVVMSKSTMQSTRGTYKYLFIMLTCPCNVHPLTPHFYIYALKLGFTWVFIFSLFFALKHRSWVIVRTATCPCNVNPPYIPLLYNYAVKLGITWVFIFHWAVLTCKHNLCFDQK